MSLPLLGMRVPISLGGGAAQTVWHMPDTPSGPRLDQMTWLLQTMATQPDCVPGPTARQWESIWVWDLLFLLYNRFTASIFRDKIFLELIFLKFP